MSDTLLQIVTEVTGELGLPQPSVVATATDPQTIQLFSLAKRAVKDLQQDHPWTVLQKLFVINLQNAIVDTGTLTQGNATIAGLQASTISAINAVSASAFIVAGDSLGGIPVSARVVSAVGTTVTLDSQASGSGSSSIQFSQDTFQMPADFDRYIGNTWWDRTNRWALIGPDSPQIDQWHRSGIVVIGPRRHFRQVGSNVTNTPPGQFMWRIWPPLTPATTNPQELVFEYISSNCINVMGGGTTLAENFANDTDISMLSGQALVMGLKWRWAQAKRYQYADYQAEWQEYVNRLKARDGGTRVLSLSSVVDDDYLIDSRNVQDGFYPGTSSVSGQ